MLLTGRPISPGAAHGPAQVVDARVMLTSALATPPRGPSAGELERLLAAIGRACVQLDRVKRQLDGRVARSDSAIFDSHAGILRDAKFVEQLQQAVLHQGLSAEAAVAQVVNQAYATFTSSRLPLVRDKAADLLDIGRRLLECLSAGARGDEPARRGAVIVAASLTPSELVRFAHQGAAGIVTESCGQRSHTAILARGLGLPLITGVAAAAETIPEHAEVFLDAESGQVFVAPTEEEQPQVARIAALLPGAPQQRWVAPPAAITRDGQPVTLLLNISDWTEAGAVRQLGAAGVGLFRTEFLYMDRAWWPAEQECFNDYQAVAEAMGTGELNLRLADFGAEKCPQYADIPLNRNPSLGLRGVRLLLQRPDILKPQVSAVARLSARRPVTLLLPMLDTLDTLERILAQLRELLNLNEGAALPFRIGAMVELPSAALMIEEILPRVDSVAIGLNDLTQYMLAADRDDELVEAYHDAMQPAILRLLKRVVEAADKAGRPATVCGELAGDPALTGLLLALGVRRLSVSRFSYRPVVEAVRRLPLDQVLELTPELLAASTGAAVRELVLRRFLPLATG